MLLEFEAAGLEVEQLMGLGLAQGDFEEEVGFCVLLAHFWDVYNISYLGWVKIIIID